MKNSKSQILIVLCILCLGFVETAFAQTKTLKNIGFTQGNIWYSKDPFFEGDRIRIYTTVFNGSQYDFRGTLEFFVGGKSIGKTGFSLVSGAFQVLWADWTAGGGGKKIYASISDAKISLPGGAEETVILENSKTGEKEVFVDKDSDKDRIGDKNDPKDDRVSEKKEVQPQSSFIKDSQNATTSETAISEQQKIVESAKSAMATASNFLDGQKEKAIAKKAELQKKLGEGESLFEFDFGNLLGLKKDPNPPETSAGENKNLLKLYILALSGLIFSLEYKAIIYLLGIYVSYRLLKFFFKKLFFRSVDN